MQGSNRALFVVALITNFAISDRFLASVCVSVVLFALGKLLDYFVKPIAQEKLSEWRARRKSATSIPVKRRIGFGRFLGGK